MLLDGVAADEAPNEKVGAGVELPTSVSVEKPGVWPANVVLMPLEAGVCNPVPKENGAALSEVLGVTAKLTEGFVSTPLEATGLDDPKVKAGLAGAVVSASDVFEVASRLTDCMISDALAEEGIVDPNVTVGAERGAGEVASEDFGA